ncbi:hypothetical protein BD779DRAFT_1669457 [Infundibulicybe gibba]|nr:hypothetical protein BD779DRAFT_1669457 [Infundibulicybe gibba]
MSNPTGSNLNLSENASTESPTDPLKNSPVPYGSANRTFVEHIGAMPNSKECVSCRVIRSGTFAGVGAYALWQSRAAAPGSLWQKRIVGGLGVAMLAGSVTTWWQCKYFVLVSLQLSIHDFPELPARIWLLFLLALSQKCVIQTTFNYFVTQIHNPNHV